MSNRHFVPQNALDASRGDLTGALTSSSRCSTFFAETVYLTSFVHREELFDIAERWLCNRLEPTDGLRLTQILICDGFVLGETLGAFARLLL